MTQTFTTILTWVVSSINLVLAIYLLVSKFWVRTVNHAVNVQDGSKKSQEFYKQLHITVAHMFEDITIAAAFMLLVSTFSAHGGTHDDTDRHEQDRGDDGGERQLGRRTNPYG